MVALRWSAASPERYNPFQEYNGLPSFTRGWPCILASPVMVGNKGQEMKELCESGGEVYRCMGFENLLGFTLL